MSAPRVSPSLALAAYAETWISGAKVIVFGDALSPLPERLVERGARLVQVYDRDAARAAEAAALEHSRQISYAPLEGAGSSVRDGAFDFGIIEDLSAAQRSEGLPLAPLRRALGRRGMALIATRNPEVGRCLIPCRSEGTEPLGYYELFELVSQHFEEVRMLGQTAFVGYAVADFGAAEDADVRLDTAFLPGGAEEPEWFLALVSTLPVASEAFSVIQIPLTDLPSPEPAEPVAADREELAQLESALEQARHRITELERSKAAREAAREPRELAAQQRAQLEALQGELAKREQWLAGLESRAATADQRADEMQAELDRLSNLEARARQERDQLQKRLEEQQKRLEEQQRRFEEQQKRLEEQQRRFEEQQKRLEEQQERLQDQDKHLEEERRARRSVEEGKGALQRKLDELTKQNEAAARSSVDRERQTSSLTRRVEELSAELHAAQQRAARAGEESLAESRSELEELERLLVERGAEVARLNEALEQTERFGRQLIAEVAQWRATASADLQKREIEQLARRNAQLEADLEAARWTISSLGANGVSRAAGMAAFEPPRTPGGS